MILAENLTKRYGPTTAIEGVGFHVAQGEIVGFLGPNGAGKTTTMRILTCFFPPTEGTARVAGFDVFEKSLEVRKRIGYLPEATPLYTDMRVNSYLDFVASVKGYRGPEKKSHVGEVVDLCGLRGSENRIIGKLSKGYRQRVGLAQSLLHEPEVLILDEPTIGLDPQQIIEIRNLIKNLGEKRTVILSTHILPEVSMVCNRVIIINKGRIVATDTPANLTQQLMKTKVVHVRVDGPAEEIAQKLSQVPGVLSVSREVSAAVVHGGWGLLQLVTQELSLEDVFLELVTQEPAEKETAA